jgi:hypothetical protein
MKKTENKVAAGGGTTKDFMGDEPGAPPERTAKTDSILYDFFY